MPDMTSIRFVATQFLVYKILDALTQTFFPVLPRIDDDIDEIEQQVIEDPREDILKRIFSIKRDLVDMRRVVSPERDVFARDAERISELRGLEGDGRLYFRDLYDSLNRVSELVDSYRDLLSGAADMYLSTVANRQGEVNKQLTMIATIFLPLTFLTGFFGQRCRHATAASSSSRRRQLRPLQSRAGYALAGAGSSTRRGSSVSRAITNR